MNRIDGGAAGARSGNMLGGAAAGLLLAAGIWGAANAQPAPGSAPDQQAASEQPRKQNTDPGDKVTCKYEEETGSRLGGHKICHTRREWDQMNKDAASLVNTLGRDPGAGKAADPGGPGPH